MGFDWPYWLLRLHGAGGSVFFLAAGAAWYGRFRLGPERGTSSGTA